jgi:Tfp pilus assembly protein PilN
MSLHETTQTTETAAPARPATAPALPRVNLLPVEIQEAARFRRVQLGLAGLVAAAVALVAAGYVMSMGQVTSAQDELDTYVAQGAALQAKADQYAEVPLVYAQVAAAEAGLQTAMGQEVRYSYLLNDLSLTIPDKVWVSEIVVAQNTAEPTVGAFGAAGIGTVTVSGSAVEHNDVAGWLDWVGQQPAYADPTFTKSTDDAATYASLTRAYESSFLVTDQALSNRYTKAGQ